MALTDLTGTTWRLNETIDLTYFNLSTSFSIMFTSNNHRYFSFNFSDPSADYDYNTALSYLDSSYANYVYYDSWTNQAYRLIEITGGTDATNANLIAFIQANAEQIIVDTGVKLLKSGTSVIGKINAHYVSSVNGTNVMSGIVADTPTGYDVTIALTVPGSNTDMGYITVWDGRHETNASSAVEVFKQTSLDPSAFPKTLSILSGYCTVSVGSLASFVGNFLDSTDFTVVRNDGMTKEFVIDKNGTIRFGADDWDD